MKSDPGELQISQSDGTISEFFGAMMEGIDALGDLARQLRSVRGGLFLLQFNPETETFSSSYYDLNRVATGQGSCPSEAVVDLMKELSK